MNQQPALADQRESCILGCIKSSGSSRVKEVILPLSSALMRPHCTAVSGLESSARERAGPEEGYDNGWGLDYLSYKGGWRDLELFSMEKRRVWVNHIVTF